MAQTREIRRRTQAQELRQCLPKLADRDLDSINSIITIRGIDEVRAAIKNALVSFGCVDLKDM